VSGCYGGRSSEHAAALHAICPETLVEDATLINTFGEMKLANREIDSAKGS